MLAFNLWTFTYVRRLTKSRREVTEINRNYALLTGQILFLTVVGLADNVSDVSCIIITVITHYAWMVTFCWTGKLKYIIHL